MPQSAKSAHARRQTERHSRKALGGEPDTATVLRVVPKSAKGADARRRTEGNFRKALGGEPDTAPVLRVFLRKRVRSQRGAALVEFALIAPLFFLIVFGLVELAIIFAGYCSAAYASQLGVRYAIVHGVDASGRVASDDTAIKALMSSYLWAAQSTGSNISIIWNPDDSIGSGVSVNVSLTYSVGVPWLGLNQIKVGSTSTGTVLF